MKNTHSIAVMLGSRSYTITVAAGLLSAAAENLRGFVADRKCLVISDDHVDPLYGATVAAALTAAGANAVSRFVYPAGEAAKTLQTIAAIYQCAVDCELNRKSLIIALGGGVCGDMAGFAAATYMRGIDFIQVPTSLLAMVDSSVGGKTGIDLPAGKNLVGAFRQPKAVLIDPECLTTLPLREIRCGLAEIVKYGVIMDCGLFELLENNLAALSRRDSAFYAGIIARCCRLKAEVVAEDELETGRRVILNYGHTFGHAVEAVSEYRLGHGESIAIGMNMAAELAAATGRGDAALAVRQRVLLEKLGLPVRAAGLVPEKIFSAMRKDKKKTDNGLKLILPETVGQVAVVDNVADGAILSVIRSNCD